MIKTVHKKLTNCIKKKLNMAKFRLSRRALYDSIKTTQIAYNRLKIDYVKYFINDHNALLKIPLRIVKKK